MNRRLPFAVPFALVVALSGPAPLARAQEAPKPTEHHKRLEKQVGVWDAKLLFFPPGSEKGEPAGEGVETNRMLGGGLWLVSDFKADFGATPFEGHGTTGYDTKKGKYVGNWVDSFETRIATNEGTYDEKTKTLTMLGKGTDPTSGKPTDEKQVTTFSDDDNRVFTLYMKTEGSDDFVKVMSIDRKSVV